MKTYFKICLWSPIWFPVLLGGVSATLESITGYFYDIFPEGLAFIGIVVVYSLFFGGLQYLLSLAFIWRRIDFNSFKSWLKWILWLPIIFTPIQVIGLWLYYSIATGRVDYLDESLAMMGFNLGLGYAYVLLWLLGYAILNGIQQMRREASDG